MNGNTPNQYSEVKENYRTNVMASSYGLSRGLFCIVAALFVLTQIFDKSCADDNALSICIQLRKGARCNITINSHSVGGVSSYKLNFGDNTPEKLFVSVPTVYPHAYATVGEFSVVLTMVGTATIVTKKITVKEAISNATITMPSFLCIVGGKTTFTITIIPSIVVHSYNKLGSAKWTKGTEIACTTTGQKSLAVFVENGVSAVLFKCLLNITVITLDFTVTPAIALTNASATFTPTASIGGLRYLFVFPGSLSVNCTNASLPYIFNVKNESPGHLVTLIATDDKGNSVKISKNVTVQDPLTCLVVQHPAFVGVNMDTVFKATVIGKPNSFSFVYGDNTPMYNTSTSSASHVYTKQGKFTVTVYARNSVSVIIKVVTVVAVEGIQGLSCAEAVIATPLGKPTALGWVVYNGTEFAMKFQVNPSLPTYLITNISALDVFVVYKQHNYTAVGEYITALQAWNRVNNVSANCIVVVQEPITFVAFKVVHTSQYLEMNTDFTIQVNVIGTRPLVEYHFDSSTKYNSSSLTAQHKFLKYGSFNICITARNNVSSMVTCKQVYVPKPVLNLTTLVVQTKPTNLTNKSNVVIRIGQGSDFKCNISYGNSVTLQYCYTLVYFSDNKSLAIGPFQNIAITETYLYTKEGCYTVNVFCYNRLGNVSYTSTVVVQKSILGFKLTSLPPQILGTTIKTLFTLTKGTNVTVTYYINDVKSGSTIVTDTGGFINMQYKKNYNDVGYYQIKAYAKNLVSEYNSSSYTLRIQQAITSLKCNAWSLAPFEKHGLPSRCKNESNTFNVEYPMILPANPDKGTNLTCYYSFDDGRTVNTTNRTVQHKYAIVHKAYKPSVTCYNLVSSVSCCFPLTMEKAVKSMAVKNDGPKKYNTLITFSVNVGDYGTGTCFSFDWMDGTPIHVVGQSHCTNLTFSQGQEHFTVAEGTDVITAQHAYAKVNEYFVHVNATNNVSCLAQVSQAVSVLKECHYPNVTMRDASDNDTLAPGYYRSETKQFSNDVSVYCEVSPHTNYTWKVTRVKNIQNETLDQPELMVLPNVNLNNPILTLFQRMLPYGTFELEVIVYMSKTVGVRTIEKRFIRITCTPYIMANIKDGTKLKRIIGDKIPVNGTTSFDPDQEPGDLSNMTFYWFCRKMTEKPFSMTDPESIPYITIPDKAADPSKLTAGGCFGTGAGRLPLNASLIEIDTSRPGIKEGVNNTIVITLYVVKNDTCGARFGHFNQYLELAEGPIPLLSTKCIQNCLPKVNTNDKLSHQTNCTNCNIDTTFQWTIDKLLSCDGNPIDSTNKQRIPNDKVTEMMYGSSKSLNMVVKENSLAPDTCYTYTMRATNKDGKFGENAFTVRTNACPSGGTMHVSPVNGTTLNTTYTAYFQNWDDTDIPLMYSCGYKDGQDFKLLASSSVTALRLTLPTGKQEKDYDVTVVCKVTDRSGCATTVQTTVKVFPIGGNSSAALLEALNQTVNGESGIIRTAIQEGNIQKLLQVTVAVAGMLEDLYKQGQEDAGKNLTDAEKQKLEESKRIRAEIQQSLLEVLNDHVEPVTLQDANALSGAVASLTGGYKDLSGTSQELSLKLMDSVVDQITKASPSSTSFGDITDTARSIIASLGQVASASAESATFNTSDSLINVTGITGDSNLKGMVSSSERAKDRVNSLLNTVSKVSEALLNYQLPGEPPQILKTSTLNTTISKTLFTEFGNSPIGDGRMEINLPSVESMGLTLNDPTKDFVNFVASSSLNCLFSWTNTSDLVKSQQVNIGLSDPSGKPIDTSSFGDYAEIDVPNDASKMPALEANFFRIYEEDEASVTHMQIHILNMSSPEVANHLQVFPDNDSQSFQVLINFGERALPVEGKYAFNYTIPNFDSCTINYVNKSRTIVDGNTTHHVHEVEPSQDCKEDPHTVFVPYSLFNKTGIVFISVLTKEEKVPQPTEAAPVRKKRAVPGVPCGSSSSHGRMKRSCVIIPPPPPTPPTEPPWGAKYVSGTRPPNLDFLGRPMDMNKTIKYKTRIYQSNCIFFDKEKNSWNNRGCVVGNQTRVDRVQCLCNHFTSFGSDFLVAPNPIDFDKVFSADLSKNPVVLSVVCGLFGLYLILVVFARRADKNDEKKTGVTPLPANAAPGSHSYLISIHTGVRYNAGTTAQVYVVLSGEEGESPPVLLKDPMRPLFTRGADNSLVMTIPKDIGRVTHARLWHDNTGTSPSWYLSRIMLEDLHDRKKIYFVCERWFAVEEEDGRVDRIFPVASKKELTKFNQLFVSKTVRELGDGHLWFSIIARPPQSVFTRVQRLSVALSLLYCTMITSCMFYNTGGQKENTTYIFYLGSVKIDLRQMVIGLQASLIVFPVNLALMQIFRKIRPDEPAKSDGEDFENISTCSNEEERAEKTEDDKKKKKKGLHPRWRYVAWVICALSTCAAATFTVFYSLSWGPVVANKWLTAFVLSFFQSVLLIQPVKVVFAAIVFALIIKKPIENEEENEEEVTECMNKTNDNKAMMTDDFLFHDGTRVGPPDELLLLAAREKRLKEIRMQTILREIFAYFLFMAVLLLVAHGNRDPNAYLMRKSLYEQFVTPSTGSKVPFYSVGDVDSFWDWSRETLVPTMYPAPLYDGKPDKDKGFLEDRHNYLVGISRLRQERIKQDTCRIVPVFKHIFQHCYGTFSMSNAEKEDFDVGWKYLNKSKNAVKRKRRSIEEQMPFVKEGDKLIEVEDVNKVLVRKRRAIDPVYVSTSGRQARKRSRGESKKYVVLESAMLPDGSIMSCPTRWQYHSVMELRGFPYWGTLNFYSGGGYPADLGYDYNTAMTVVADVNSHNWLNIQSRSVFIEFTIYNANTNLFAAAFLFMEFLPNGGAFATASFGIARLYSYVGPFAKLILGMEIFMLLFMLYFMYREFKLMYRQGKAYFHGFWNLIEVVLIVLEFIMVILFLGRMWETDKNLIKLHHNPKDFVSFQYATAADQTLTYVIGLLVFLVILRFIKLLRFNKKMAFIGTTIGIISKPIAMFMISFFVIFNAYGFFGVLVFGPTVESYKDFLSSAVTQMRIVLGDFDYYEISGTSKIYGPLYFFSYMYLIVFFLMNMFVAIINDSFSEVKELENELSNEYEMVDFILEKLKSQLSFMKKGQHDHVKTPYGLGLAIPFWEYKRRKDSISSDSEFSCTTNFTALRAKRNIQLMEEDLNEVLKRLTEVEIEDIESDEVLKKVTQVCTSQATDYDIVSISDSECSTPARSEITTTSSNDLEC